MLFRSDDDEALFAAIMAGAAGYVLKQIRGTDLVDGVRRVNAGQSLLDPAVTAQVLERIRTGIEEPKELKALTDQERRILEYIAEGLTNHEIAQRMFLADKTVKNYVSSVLAKLGLERRTQAAVLATRLLGGSRQARQGRRSSHDQHRSRPAVAAGRSHAERFHAQSRTSGRSSPVRRT